MRTTTASADPRAFAKLQDLVREIDVAMVTTVTPDGALHSRPMFTRRFDDEGRIWFFSADDSDMAHDLDEEHAVNLSYADPKKHRYVSVTGNAVLLHDPAKAKELWSPSLSLFFPQGLDDPHLAVLCVRIETAVYWDAPGSKRTQLFGTGHDGRTDSAAGENVKVEVRSARESG